MYTALLMICLMDQPSSNDNCIILQNDKIYKTERKCMEAAAYLLNSNFFQTVYADYEPRNLECYSWIDNKPTI